MLTVQFSFPLFSLNSRPLLSSLAAAAVFSAYWLREGMTQKNAQEKKVKFLEFSILNFFIRLGRADEVTEPLYQVSQCDLWTTAGPWALPHCLWVKYRYWGKNLETFIAIWCCHNIQMQDRQTRWTVYRSKTLVCDNWKWNEIIFTTDCLIFSSCALVWCFRLTEMLWTQRKEELEGSKSVENFSVPHILCPSPRSPSIAINGGQGAGSGRGKLPTGEQVISLTDWEIGIGRNPRPFFK